MSQEQINRLQGLLERIQKNATVPRAVAAAAAPPAAAAITGEEETIAHALEDEDTAEQPIPPAAAAPVEVELLGQAPELDIVEVELGEEEIVDITDVEDIGAVELATEEEPPASSRRPIAGNMSEALAKAADSADVDDGREIPLKTPPPESGPQAAPPSTAGAPTEIDELIGEPIEHPPAPAHAIVDEHAPSGVIEVAERVEPQVVQRSSAASTNVPAIFLASRSFQPHSFLELLDASLELGR